MITGSGQWTGRAFALRFAAEGADVVLVELNADGAHAVAAAIEGAGDTALVQAADVSDEAAVGAAAATAGERFGRIDILPNNASVVATTKMGVLSR